MGSGFVGDIVDDVKNNILDQLTGRVYLRDYTHAAKNFLPGNMGNAGKVKFTFHTWFQINPTAYSPPTGSNIGLLVKSVKLPTFNMEVQELNQYNRKRLIQSKIKYQPIDITFHDDNASQVTALWDAYYRYNFADAWNPIVAPFANATQEKDYNRRNIYDPTITGDTEYGYRGDARGQGGTRADGGEKVPFFNNITIYGMWAGQYIAYTLINPIITTMDHDTYDYADGGGTMQNRMTINYETVIYNSGEIGDIGPDSEGSEEVAGFAGPDSYDRRESPLLQGGSSPSDIFGRVSSLGGDDSLLEKARTVGQLYDGGLDSVVDSAKKAVGEGIKDAALAALGLGGDTNTPTNASSPAMVNISNQGAPTGTQANPIVTGAPPNAGSQTGVSGAADRAADAFRSALGF
jgi:hypothetical protein